MVFVSTLLETALTLKISGQANPKQNAKQQEVFY
jgi:hypothetical protein